MPKSGLLPRALALSALFLCAGGILRVAQAQKAAPLITRERHRFALEGAKSEMVGFVNAFCPLVACAVPWRSTTWLAGRLSSLEPSELEAIESATPALARLLGNAA